MTLTRLALALVLSLSFAQSARAQNEPPGAPAPEAPAPPPGEKAPEPSAHDPYHESSFIERDTAVPREWRIELAPYFFFGGILGEAGSAGKDVTVELPPGDLLENLTFGAMATAEIRFWRVGLLIDGMYAATNGDTVHSTDGKASADIDAEHLAVGFSFLARVYVDERVTIDPYLGFRTNRVAANVDVDYADPAQSDVNQSVSANWTDPIIGARFTFPLPDAWSIVIMGDVGGFGMGSRLAWQAYGGVRWDITEHIGVTAGWKAIGVDYEKDFVYDCITQGIQVGIVFGF